MIFITRKGFEEEVNKKVREAEDKMWLNERLRETDRELHKRIDRLEARICELEMKGCGKKMADVADHHVTSAMTY